MAYKDDSGMVEMVKNIAQSKGLNFRENMTLDAQTYTVYIQENDSEKFKIISRGLLDKVLKDVVNYEEKRH